MAKIHHGKLGNWLASFGLLLILLTVTSAQPGFLSISCGGKTNHIAENTITWVTDADYINVGRAVDIGNASRDGTYLHSLRFFPVPLIKSCYKLPMKADMPYLVRLWFAIGTYNGYQNWPSFQFSIETLDMLHVVNVTTGRDRDPFYYHRILVSSGDVLYICLIRTSVRDDPFISAIELRRLQHGMYRQAKPGRILMPVAYNVGGKYTIRYPQDQFDRIWIVRDSILNTDNQDVVRPVSSQAAISAINTEDHPPTAVMQTAWVGNNWDIIPISVASTPQGTKSLLLLYFAELEGLNMSESRSFYVAINGERQSETITLVRDYSAHELTFLPNQIQYYFNVIKDPNSDRRPILNAFEYHWLSDTDQATYSQDIRALDALKRSFDIKNWISDPCYLVEWEGIGCDNSSSDIRISKLYLSRRNLTGFLPQDVALLTALVNLSLGNNHLIGSLPDLSNLTSLERLYLQNNNLNGTVPAWLSELKNLKELNIENNNFSGVIPAQLLHNCSLKINYSGNPYLRMEKRKCTLDNSKINNSKVLMGTTLGGILIIVLGLIVGGVVCGVVCRNRFRRKEEGAVNECTRVEQDYSRIKVPNPTNCLAFTLDEMTTATETFSREIGRGGFGSVFFGKLPEGKEIAVKVLSLFSHQGVDEFLNEVDLLSRINHRNLVSLLGYCNETREVMLIYEHMSKGSLRDHLYGPRAENSQLTWKARIKITLDAAQGLEYLHLGCTPMIIHRDVKTANILLDGNLTGKVADFGLSRMTIDGQATHVTTAVKGTFGYLDPEYYSTQMLTEKSDVYSFGVVLLEIICGRPPIDLKLAEEDINIIRWATPYILDDDVGKIREIIDKRLDGRYDMKSMTRVAKVAMRCVQVERSFRPSMSEVVAELKEALKLEDIIASVSVSEEIGIEGGDLVADRVESSKRRGMEWSDNSSNIPLVGR